MAWARLDDRFHEHPKVIAAGPEAVGVWTMCLTWASAQRRTAATPGVIPQAVIVRFAGSRAKKITSKLAEAGLLDAQTADGWPIHDFADYLPKYDADANRERGRRGGHAKAAKQTASKPLGEPPEESEAVGHENAKQTSGMRASVRRNPVPVPSEEAKASSAQPTESTDAGKIVKDWIDRQRRRPADRVVGQVAKQVRELLDQDFTRAEIDAGLTAMNAKGLHPSTLSSLVSAAANSGNVTPIRGDGHLTREQIDDILGPDSESLPMPPPEIDDADHATYQAWLLDAQQARRAERERLALAHLERAR